MAKSGKAKLIKGSATYLWEEMKTMNKRKLKAMGEMASGYISMKLSGGKKKPTSDSSPVRRTTLSPIER